MNTLIYKASDMDGKDIPEKHSIAQITELKQILELIKENSCSVIINFAIYNNFDLEIIIYDGYIE